MQASEYWGGRAMHSTHGVHPKAPNKHIFRLANDEEVRARDDGLVRAQILEVFPRDNGLGALPQSSAF